MGICGIYILKWKNSTESYIGQSINIERRISSHKSGINTSNHENTLIAKMPIEDFYYEVLEKCDEKDLDIKESEWIRKLHPTLNRTTVTRHSNRGALAGAKHGMSKYSKEQIVLVANMLAAGEQYTDISDKSGVSYQIVASIVAGTNHTWLANEYPELYNKILDRKRKKPVYTVIKDSINYTFNVPKHFCEQNNINYSNFVQMLKGKRNTCQGYTLLGFEY